MMRKAKRQQPNSLSGEIDKELNNVVVSEIKKFTKQQKIKEFERWYRILRKTHLAIQPLIWALYHKNSIASVQERKQIERYKYQLDVLQELFNHLFEFEPQEEELRTGMFLFLWPPLQKLSEIWSFRGKEYQLRKKKEYWYELLKKPWKRVKWSPSQKGWTHDHCEICFRSISDKDELKVAYNYSSYWLCPRCFRKLRTNRSI